MVLTTSITTSTFVLAVFANTTVAVTDVALHILFIPNEIVFRIVLKDRRRRQSSQYNTNVANNNECK